MSAEYRLSEQECVAIYRAFLSNPQLFAKSMENLGTSASRSPGQVTAAVQPSVVPAPSAERATPKLAYLEAYARAALDTPQIPTTLLSASQAFTQSAAAVSVFAKPAQSAAVSTVQPCAALLAADAVNAADRKKEIEESFGRLLDCYNITVSYAETCEERAQECVNSAHKALTAFAKAYLEFEEKVPQNDKKCYIVLSRYGNEKPEFEGVGTDMDGAEKIMRETLESHRGIIERSGATEPPAGEVFIMGAAANWRITNLMYVADDEIVERATI